MAVTKAQKVEILAELKEKMQQSKSIIFAHYIGMPVADVSELRRDLKKTKSEMKVAKKNLMRIAAKDLNLPEPPDEMLDGAVACIFSFEDPLTGAQVAFKFSKKHKQVELIGGIYEGKLISKEEAIAIAKIPGKQALLSMFAAMCIGPLSSFARGLSELAKMKTEPAPSSGSGQAPEEPKKEELKAEAPAAEAPASAPAPADVPPATEAPATSAGEAAPNPPSAS